MTAHSTSCGRPKCFSACRASSAIARISSSVRLGDVLRSASSGRSTTASPSTQHSNSLADTVRFVISKITLSIM